MKDQEPRKAPEGILTPQKPLSIEDVYTGSLDLLPYPKDAAFGSIEVYEKLATAPLYPYFRETGGRKDFFIASSPIRGKELQHLFHFAAPSKLFGLDDRDTQNDWHDLYTKDYHAQRLKAHQSIPNWQYFEAHRTHLRTFIGRDFAGFSHGHSQPGENIVPVVHITEESGKKRWNFEPLDDAIATTLVTPETVSLPSSEFFPTLGPLLIAAFSPAHTRAWGTELSYLLNTSGRKQDMGSTQALALTLAKADTLFDTELLQALLTYAETGTIPEKKPIRPIRTVAQSKDTNKPNYKESPFNKYGGASTPITIFSLHAQKEKFSLHAQEEKYWDGIENQSKNAGKKG